MDTDREEDLLGGGVNNEDIGQPSNIHISDVIAAIQNTDPSFEANVQLCGEDMFGGVSSMPGPVNPPMQAQPIQSRRRVAHVKVVEQPASKSLRFRYECEGRSAGSIPGIHSTPENKTYPTIEIVGYKGRAVVVVSCVTKDPPYRPHPHNLVGKDGCKKGVCTVEISSESMCVSFSNLGIQCVKKKDIDEALRVREEIRVDPFKTGFTHRTQPTSIDLNAVRLCFQVFLEGPEKGRFTHPLTPVVSDVIFDKKAMSDLVICKMSHCSAPAAGGHEIILLCEKVAKEDISIRFYEEKDGNVVWEGWGDFQHANVHKQVAITFRSPRYDDYLKINQSVKVYIQLKRPSDGATSEPLPFELRALMNSDELRRKQPKLCGDTNLRHLRDLPPPLRDAASMDPLAQIHPSAHLTIGMNVFNILPPETVKLEPMDRASTSYGNRANFGDAYRTVQGTPSPQPSYLVPSPSSDYGTENWARNPIGIYSNAPQAIPVQLNIEHNTMGDLFNMDATLPNLNSAELNNIIDDSFQPSLYPNPEGRIDLEHEVLTDSFSGLRTSPYDI